ncbi:ParA family protein [Marinobacter halophilus]|uniref:Chromosome partitioning protein n=1 Tax=Marinobacter halophilus TaxID=1323740 RepID=A0A2T1KIH6_9GAMM|nr:AAA family ATPase [Marinobacter halophilus]PSF09967.1 chromosome partitioning protein [Marinobacter halophilus]GGC66587.1 chromosome partitioning protein Soj [Marinobacter halophilus]
MARVIAVTNQKGGVGKTTTCVNLAASLAATKRRVLLVDLDPQGNATMGSGVDKNSLQLSGYDVLTKRATPAEVIVWAEASGFDILPANGDLTAAEVELMNEIGREHRLRLTLNTVRENYDYILIDCPPSLNLLTVNALSAADSVLIPMQCEYYALEGLAALMNTVEQIQETVNPNLEVEGILRTMYDPRNSLTLDVSSQLSEFFGDKVYRAVIPRNVRLAEAPSYGMPALAYDRASKGAIAYLALAGEMVRRHGSKKTAATVAV